MAELPLGAKTVRAAPPRRATDRHAPCLILIHPLERELGRRIDLLGDALRVGRDPGADVPLDYPSVSRRHARLERHGGLWAVEDVGSTNGTRVNGELIMERTLAEADLVAFGSVILKYLSRRGEEQDFHAELQRRATLDALTGAYNQRAFLDLLAHALAQAGRTRLPVSLLMLDLDHFKRVNDAHGHLVGDRALRALVERVSGHLRSGDLLGRYGGEEFAVLLPETHTEGAIVLAERLRVLVADEPFGLGGVDLPLTVSVGVATVTEEVAPEVLIALADAELYEAKRGGRNRVAG